MFHFFVHRHTEVIALKLNIKESDLELGESGEQAFRPTLGKNGSELSGNNQEEPEA